MGKKGLSKRTCIVCGKEFHNTNVRQLYCSEECKRQDLTITCKQCGKPFMLSKHSEKRWRTFCSKSCGTTWRNTHAKYSTRKLYKCETCGKEFCGSRGARNKHFFCSHECYLIWARKDLPKDKICEVCGKPLVSWPQINRGCCSDECFEKAQREKHWDDFICEFCGKKFSRWKCMTKGEHHFCSHKCYTSYMIANTQNEDMAYGKFRSRLTSTKQSIKWAKEVMDKYDGKCAICGATEDITVHHIIPVKTIIRSMGVKDYNYENLMILADNPLLSNVNNGIVLCKKHHGMCHGRFNSKK